MSITLKKVIFAISFNSCLFLLLMICIQNSSNKSKINFLIDQTIPLPISFIIGTNFICGSLIGSILQIGDTKRN